MAHSRHGEDQTPERFRPFLRVLVAGKLSDNLQGKVDLSVVVSQTILEAFNNCKNWDQLTIGQRIAWLKSALSKNLIDEVRKVTIPKRDVTREQSLQKAMDNSYQGLEGILAASGLTPHAAAERQELLLILAQKLQQLPEGQSQAIQLKYQCGLSLAEIAAKMDRSEKAVAGLLQRAKSNLSELLKTYLDN